MVYILCLLALVVIIGIYVKAADVVKKEDEAKRIAQQQPVEQGRTGILPAACTEWERLLAGELGRRTAAMTCSLTTE